MRDKVWVNYRPGQCDDWKPSPEYLLAAKEAVIYLAKSEGREPDTSIYDTFLRQPEMVAKIKEIIDASRAG